MILSARDVQITESEYDAELSFIWPHPTREWDCLTFERPWPQVETAHGPSSVWVSRRAPFYSGCPGIERFELCCNAAHVTFTKELANKLETECQVSIVFELDNERFDELRKILARVFEACPWYFEAKGSDA